MHQYFARPFQLPWLSCFVLAVILVVAAMIRGGGADANADAAATAKSATDNVLTVHARTNRTSR